MLEGGQISAEIIQLHDHKPMSLDMDSLNSLQLDLASVDQVTEAIFLGLGSKIEGFHCRALEISSDTEKVFSLLQGESGEGTLQHLQLLVERCNLWLGTTNDKSTQICTLLYNVNRQIDGFVAPVSGLRKVIKTLHSLRVSTRIEAAKGYATGAGVLAQSLDELGNLVHQKITEIIELSEVLRPMINASLEMEQKAQAGAGRIAKNEVPQARHLLNSLMEGCLEAGQWTERLKSRSEEVAQSFGEMIVALQFQDITRQRLEHVEKALSALGAHAEKLQKSPLDTNIDDVSRLYQGICRLQHDQLSLACDEFMSAAENLSNNLHTMTSSVLSMAEDTRELSRSTDLDSEHRFERVLAVLKAIADYLDQTLNVHQESRQKLAEVCQGIQKVSRLVQEIELIGEEMQLLAMNAAISAAHARQRGAGLDIIAQNIHTVAEEATAYALTLARECEEITNIASDLQEIEGAAKSNASDVTNLLGEAQERMSMIEDNSLQLVALTGDVNRAANNLACDVDIVVKTLDIKERFQEKVSPVIERLNLLGGVADSRLTDRESANLDVLFGELEYCYTMDSERLVHKQFVAETETVTNGVCGGGDEWAENRHHDLGDNVDLF